MNDPEIIEWTYLLQITLQQMSDADFEKYMEGKVLRLDGKLYGLTKKELQ
jgi:hypothetical protein